MTNEEDSSLLSLIGDDNVPAVLEVLEHCSASTEGKTETDTSDRDDIPCCFFHTLMETIRQKSHNTLRELLEKYPNSIKALIQTKPDPLHVACQLQDPQAVRVLLQAGADPNLVTTDTQNPSLPPLLTLTDTSADSLACRRWLLQHHADPNARFPDNGHTLLHWDCLRPNMEGADLLLQYGANANCKPSPPHRHHGTVPSHIAYWTRNLDLGQLLKQHGATFGVFYEIEMYQTLEAYLKSSSVGPATVVNECPFDGLGLLHTCAFSLAKIDVKDANHLIQVALQNRVNVNLPCLRERRPTPLMIACGVGNAALSLAILQNCPESHAVTDDQGCTSLFYAVGSIIDIRCIMEKLVAVGADLNVRSHHLSRTALHEGALFYYTVPNNLKTLLRLLLGSKRRGSEDIATNITDAQGFTALHYACLPGLEGNASSARVLLEYDGGGCVNVNAHDKQGRTPLHVCSMDLYHRERRAMVRLPMEPFGPPWLPNQAASSSGLETMVKLLLQHGGDPTVTDNAGNLPFFYLCDQTTTTRDEDSKAQQRLSSISLQVRAAAHCGLFGW
eukprot:scaffold2903_cov170-Amphora_coffeaeformis.AAC.9